jgi:hypothetical protein
LSKARLAPKSMRPRGIGRAVGSTVGSPREPGPVAQPGGLDGIPASGVAGAASGAGADAPVGASAGGVPDGCAVGAGVDSR